MKPIVFILLIGLTSITAASEIENPLAHFKDIDLTQLSSDEFSKLQKAFKQQGGITDLQLKSPGRSFPWWLKQFDDPKRFYVLLQVYPNNIIPSTSFIEINLFDDSWRYISSQAIPTGYRMYIKNISLEHCNVVDREILNVKTTLDPDVDQNKYLIQSYAFIDKKFELVRVVDNDGNIVRNDYLRRPFGPETSHTVDQWLALLASENSLEQLKALVWLTGSHLESSAPREDGIKGESATALNTYKELLNSRKMMDILSKLKKSKIQWIVDYTSKFELKKGD
jgi:hypothetical protein